MIRIQMHIREIEKIRKCGEVGELYFEPTSENVRTLSTGVQYGKIIWNTNQQIKAICIEDKHESEIFNIINIKVALFERIGQPCFLIVNNLKKWENILEQMAFVGKQM
mgnify:CR=1 FL=1